MLNLIKKISATQKNGNIIKRRIQMISKIADIKDTFDCDKETAENIREYVEKMYKNYYEQDNKQRKEG